MSAVTHRLYLTKAVNSASQGDPVRIGLVLMLQEGPECNLHKGPNPTGIDTQTGDVVRLFHPRRDIWSDHCGYLGQQIVGLTAVGRTTTASLLEMNDPERRRVRELVARIQS